MKTTLKLLFALIISVSLLQVSCKKDDDEKEEESAKIATVTTTAVTNIQPTTCTTGGNITDDGNAEISMRGVCYSRTELLPTLADNDGLTTNGSGSGAFTAMPSGLLNGSVYYVRAYATNSQGTGYGEVLLFTTVGK